MPSVASVGRSGISHLAPVIKFYVSYIALHKLWLRLHSGRTDRQTANRMICYLANVAVYTYYGSLLGLWGT